MSKSQKERAELPEFDKLWDYNDPAGTEQKFRELLPAAVKSGDTSYHAQLLTQIARTQGLQRKFADAHQTLDDVKKLLNNDLIIARIRYSLERGRVYNSSGKPEESKSYFLDAWELAVKNHEEFYAIDAAHMMGIVEPPEKQLEWNLKALEQAEQTSDERARKWLGPLYNNIGWTYHDLGQYDKALELFEKGLQWREEKKDDQGIRVAKWTIGRTYRSLGRIDEAIEIQQTLKREIEEKGLPPDGYVFEELGECLLLKNKPDEAKHYFKSAYEILSRDEWLQANEPERIKRLKELGDVE